MAPTLYEYSFWKLAPLHIVYIGEESEDAEQALTRLTHSPRPPSHGRSQDTDSKDAL